MRSDPPNRPRKSYCPHPGWRLAGAGLGTVELGGLDMSQELYEALSIVLDHSEHTQRDSQGRMWLSPELVDGYGTNALSVKILDEARDVASQAPTALDEILEELELVVNEPTERAWAFSYMHIVRARLEDGEWVTEALDAHGEWPVWMDPLPGSVSAEAHTKLVAQEIAEDKLPE
jgi:hypothetical protein